jgi:hypothetical protein
VHFGIFDFIETTESTGECSRLLERIEGKIGITAGQPTPTLKSLARQQQITFSGTKNPKAPKQLLLFRKGSGGRFTPLIVDHQNLKEGKTCFRWKGSEKIYYSAAIQEFRHRNSGFYFFTLKKNGEQTTNNQTEACSQLAFREAKWSTDAVGAFLKTKPSPSPAPAK